jgi:hypothetical protein
MDQNGWKQLTSSFMLKIIHIFLMQDNFLEKNYIICQNGF